MSGSGIIETLKAVGKRHFEDYLEGLLLAGRGTSNDVPLILPLDRPLLKVKRPLQERPTSTKRQFR